MWTNEQIESFQEAAKPLIKWICENGNPHMSAIVTPTDAELVSGEIGFPCEEFIKD